MVTLNQMESAKSLIGTEINELEYISHIVLENSKTFFQIVHLNGNERLIDITEFV